MTPCSDDGNVSVMELTDREIEIKRTEAYWRSKLANEVYAYAEKIRRSTETESLGVALSAVISSAGDHIGKMPEVSS